MISRVTECFNAAFGIGPAVIARAPGRVEVLGNHTDYNEGYVLSFAIDKAVFAAVGPSSSGSIELCSTSFDGIISVREIVPQKSNSWVNYPLGVYHAMQELGLAVSPFRMAIHGNVSLGAGLSSSAALEVATALSLAQMFSLSIGQKDLAKLCQKAENEFVGTKCGLLDQFSSVFGRKGHVLFIDFRTLEHEVIRIPDPDICLAVTTSGVSHSLVESAYNDRRHECSEAAAYFGRKNGSVRTLRDISMAELLGAKGALDDLFLRRARHVVGEDDRVLEGIDLLRKGNMKRFGELLYLSHESSRDYFENSCEELDILVEATRSIGGVYGSRLTGGGFGGATLTLLHTGSRNEFARSIIEAYRVRTGKTANVHFAEIADGAGLVAPSLSA